MKHRVALLAIVALAGCNRAETGTAAAGNTSAAAVDSTETAAAAPSAPAAGAMQMKPGEWEMTTEMLAMDIPGMPAGMSPKGMSNKSTFKTCMKQQKPDASFFQGKGNKDCSYKDFSMSGGHVHGTATCNNAGQKMTMTMDGQYEPESYDMTMAMKGDQMSMKMHTAGHRTGDCTAS